VLIFPKIYFQRTACVSNRVQIKIVPIDIAKQRIKCIIQILIMNPYYSLIFNYYCDTLSKFFWHISDINYDFWLFRKIIIMNTEFYNISRQLLLSVYLITFELVKEIEIEFKMWMVASIIAWYKIKSKHLYLKGSLQ